MGSKLHKDDVKHVLFNSDVKELKVELKVLLRCMIWPSLMNTFSNANLSRVSFLAFLELRFLLHICCMQPVMSLRTVYSYPCCFMFLLLSLFLCAKCSLCGKFSLYQVTITVLPRRPECCSPTLGLVVCNLYSLAGSYTHLMLCHELMLGINLFLMLEA